MASEMPRYILQNATIFVDRESKIGQASEVSIPVPEENEEEIRNAGMVMPMPVSLGYKYNATEFKMTAFDPQVLKLFGLKVGEQREFMVTAAFTDDDGTVHSAVCYMRGRLNKADPGNWKPGDKAETSYSISWRYCKLEMDGEPIIEMDAFGVSIGGEDQTKSIREALLVS